MAKDRSKKLEVWKELDTWKKLGKNLTKNLTKDVFVDIPILGELIDALDETRSDIEIEGRFKPLEEKLSKINEDDIDKVKELPDVEKMLTKDDLVKLLNLYSRAAIEQRRKYLANAIYNVATINTTDYQYNSFFITVLSTIPDISIELLMNWEHGKGVTEEKFKALQDKYKTEISKTEVIQNCESNGLLERYDETPKQNYLSPSKIAWSVTPLGLSFRKFISGD